PNTMRQMQPAFFRLNGSWTFSIFQLFNGMVVSTIVNLLLCYFCIFHTINQSPTDPSSTTGINKTILRTSVQGIPAIYKLRVQDNITLLTFRLEVGQSFPGF